MGLLQLFSSNYHDWGWEGGSRSTVPLGVRGGVLTGCLPCRSWLAWCPRLRTLLLDLLLIYISVPFLVRLFPIILTKFVFLNFREWPRAVPAGRLGFSKQEAGDGSQNVGGAAPNTWVALGQHPSNSHLDVGSQMRDLSVPHVLQAVNNAVLPTLFKA